MIDHGASHKICNRRRSALQLCDKKRSLNPRTDVAEILAMIKELAAYEKAASSVLATEEKLLNTLSFPSNPSKGFAKTLLIFAPSSSTDSLSSSFETHPAGMALYFHNCKLLPLLYSDFIHMP